MKKILGIALSTLLTLPGAASAGDTGLASFATQNSTYMGTYSVESKLISVDIDGLRYRGHYASNVETTPARSTEVPTGAWGRAFLFASSAQILQCQLDAGFPDASGQCLDAQGRRYVMGAGAFRTSRAMP